MNDHLPPEKMMWKIFADQYLNVVTKTPPIITAQWRSAARCDGRDAAALSLENAKKTKKMEKVRKRDKAKMTENAKKTNKL